MKFCATKLVFYNEMVYLNNWLKHSQFVTPSKCTNCNRKRPFYRDEITILQKCFVMHFIAINTFHVIIINILIQHIYNMPSSRYIHALTIYRKCIKTIIKIFQISDGRYLSQIESTALEETMRAWGSEGKIIRKLIRGFRT